MSDAQPLLVLADDNMHYRSMRYEVGALCDDYAVCKYSCTAWACRLSQLWLRISRRS